MASADPVFSKEKSTDNFKLYIAIDFGTDGVGVAYAFNEKVFIHSRWKSRKHGDAIKPKTIILLDDKGETVAFGVDAKYNYMTLASSKRNEWMLFQRFKMSLYEQHIQQNDMDDEKKNNDGNKIDISTELIAANDKSYSSETVFISAFKYIHSETKKFLKRQKIKNIKDNEIQWIITVPAIWNDAAKDKMKQWSIRAGLVDEKIENQCKIVYEPDCASLSIQYEIHRNKHSINKIMDGVDCTENKDNKDNDDNDKNKENTFVKGEKYILVDAGGGTVDIACHEILGEDGKFGVKEILHPSGGPWGSCYIDDQFIKLLQDIFSKEWMHEFKKEQPNVYTEIIDKFQKSKETFYQKTDQKWHNVELPFDFLNFLEEKTESDDQDDGDDDDDNRVENIVSNSVILGQNNLVSLKEEYLKMDNLVWNSMFDYVINKTVSHIQKQLKEDKLSKDCKYLCLVGGLSRSPYFQYRMEQEFGIQSKYKLEFIIPTRPMLTVVEGAAYFGITKNYIKARVMRYTYGHSVSKSMETAKKRNISSAYIEKQKHYRKDRKKWNVNGLFSAVVRKGQEVLSGQVVQKSKNRHPDNMYSSLFIMCSNEKHPKTRDDGKKIGFARIYHDESDLVKKTMIEYHFYDTIIHIFAYPEGKPHLKKEIEIKYSAADAAYDEEDNDSD